MSCKWLAYNITDDMADMTDEGPFLTYNCHVICHVIRHLFHFCYFCGTLLFLRGTSIPYELLLSHGNKGNHRNDVLQAAGISGNSVVSV